MHSSPDTCNFLNTLGVEGFVMELSDRFNSLLDDGEIEWRDKAFSLAMRSNTYSRFQSHWGLPTLVLYNSTTTSEMSKLSQPSSRPIFTGSNTRLFPGRRNELD